MCSMLSKSKLLQVSASAQQVLLIRSALSPKHNLHRLRKRDLFVTAPLTPSFCSSYSWCYICSTPCFINDFIPFTMVHHAPGNCFSYLHLHNGFRFTKHGACGPAGGEAQQRESRGLKQAISLCESKSNKNGQNL